MRWMLIAAMTAIAAASAQTAEKPPELKPGVGRDKVVARCSACHSLDYITMNSAFLDAAGWNAEVAKMINAFGAPVDGADAQAIAEYLGRNYGARPQPDALRAGEDSAPRQTHDSSAVRPKSHPPQRSERVLAQASSSLDPSRSAGGARGPRAAARRHAEPRGPLDAVFAMLAEPWTCRTSKAEGHGARIAACGDPVKQASEPNWRPVRWRWSSASSRRVSPRS
jgi:sulfite dehydrogenase (cytochrome) subunit B